MPGMTQQERRIQNKLTQIDKETSSPQTTVSETISSTQKINRKIKQIISQNVDDDAVILRDGSVAFTSRQTGVSPTSNNHLATKKYVDDTASNTAWSISDGSTTQSILGGNTLIVADGTAINAVVTATDTLTINNTGVTSNAGGTGISVNSGTGAVTITNTGVTSNVGGTGISVNNSGVGNVTITNDGVTGITGGTAIDASSSTGSVTLSVTNDSIGDTQLAYNTGQHLTSSSAVTFATVNTGQGDNELYDMNQNVLTTSSPQFSNMTLGEYSSPNYSNGEIGTSTFASGFTGTGWKISKNGNEYDFETNNMMIRGTLSVYELLIQQIRASNGAIFVSSSAKVESASSLSASDDNGTITFEDPSNNNICPFAANDLIMMQRINPGSLVASDASGGATNVIKKLIYKVSSVSGKTITVENGGYNNTSSPSSGDDFVRIGNTSNSDRQGIIYLTSDDSNSPFIDIKSDIDSYSDWTGSTPKVRLGKLNGINDSDLGGNLSGFGLYSNNIFLKGKIVANSGTIGGINMDSNKLYVGTGTYNNSNTAFYLNDSGSFSLKDKLSWNGTTLTVNGNVTIQNPGDINTNDLNHNAGWTQNQSDTTTNNAITAAQNTANSKVKTFIQTSAPSATTVGDVWIDSNDNNKLYRASATGSSNWVAATPDSDVNTTTIIGNTVTTGFVNALNITADSVSANNVTAGTITGSTLQTGSSGQRVVIDGSSNKLNFFNSSGTSMIQMDGGGTGYSTGLHLLSGSHINLSNGAGAYPNNTSDSTMTITPQQITITTRTDYPSASGIFSQHIGNSSSAYHRAGLFSCSNSNNSGDAIGLECSGGAFVSSGDKSWFGGSHSKALRDAIVNIKSSTTSDTADGGALRIYKSGGSQYWNVNIDSGYDLSFRYNGSTNGGWISNTSNTGQITFTGQHRCKGNSGMTTADYAALEGYIVSASGSYDQMNSDNITISEALPIVALSSSNSDKKVFGVVGGREGEERTYQSGQFNSSWGALEEDDERIIINSLGEGGIWVSNLNGNLSNGDYITSSTASGLGQKQDDDILHNYTVAKITQDCDFSSSTNFQHNNQTYKKQFVGCTYHCG